ncbi:NADPH-ferrihemoprotein reductase [Wickerhamomyces ciferrii]|uniref:NADPH--cytochrome P450 reductase n=1 Tax=Wickerhamomyces ciferrii (strain ATCC 14091 / BCRC 22168 / CBS 111 / JCM 3599 / NBRC 0793 / NRRL Y-1031 F-60-10) TaxID=1206466 RepID=K0KUX3_WICCF|nr:NADPH-ferrihemoprotein reductase [Wickerhamomyces ciferrii]CCH45229.1 NADPH-ferrihemoprotein reductase [Wickerhamomyces ciferrii]
MALDTLDYSVLVALALAIAAYFTKGLLWAVPDDGTKVTATSRDIVQTVEENNKQYLVIYGSQTGTTEDYANKFAKELKSKFKLNVMVADIEDYDFDRLNELQVPISIFVATYGEGDFPDSSLNFEEHLSTLGEGDLENLNYTLFGLGNTTYEFYNAASQKTHNFLSGAGATLIGEFGKGDDGAGTLDEDYLSWKEGVLDVLKDFLKLDEHEAKFEPSLTLSRLDPGEFDEDKLFLGEPDRSYLDGKTDLSLGPFDHAHPYLAPISFSKELFNSKDRSCIHAEFDLSQTNLRYSTGDHLAVWPSNSNEKLKEFLSITNLDDQLDQVVDLKPLDSTVVIPFPTPTTVGAIFRHYKEIGGPVSRQILSTLGQFAPSEKAKLETDRLSKDKDAFASEIHSKKYDLAQVLSLLSNGSKWEIPLEFLIESLPHLQPRYYSISSSSLSEKTTVHITAVVEASEEKDGRLITGVATNLLRNIEIAQNNESSKPWLNYDLEGPRKKFSKNKLPVHVRRSTFRLPSNPSTPVIMIGPGTGVAPFRGFIRDRVKQAENGSQIGKTVLFYGSRNSTEDFLYKEEWPQYAKTLGESFELITAFSRETSKKVYVQHKLLEQADEILKLIDAGAFIYVCGDAAKMARDVNNALIEIISKGKGLTEDQAHEIIRNFKTLNKYQEDVW